MGGNFLNSIKLLYSVNDSPILRTELIEKREYQDRIASTAVTKNTLIILPTALGKTIIAIIAISRLIEGGGKALFLAPTRPLVNQHLGSLRRFIDLPAEQIVEVTGEVKKNERKTLYKNARIIVSTPQVVDNDRELIQDIVGDIKVVIFDEAHRAVGDYSYVEIASFVEGRSRIIGMTASPGSNRERIDDIMKNLHIETVEIRDENSSDVSEYMKGVEIEWVRLDMPPELKHIVSNLKEYYDSIIERLKWFIPHLTGKSRKEIIETGESISQEIRKGNRTFYSAARLRTQAIMVDYLLEFAETQGGAPFLEYLTEIKKENVKQNKLFKDERFVRIEKESQRLIGSPVKNHTPKMAKIKDILEEIEFEKAIIFCHFRITSSILSNFLRNEGYACEKFVGQSSHGNDEGLKQKDQKKIIERFRMGDTRILVATQVGEEGLDIPSADLVIFYEPVPSEIRSIQRRGRTGRFGKGRAIILVMNDSRDVSYLYISERKEKSMKNILNEKRSGIKQTTMDTFLSEGD